MYTLRRALLPSLRTRFALGLLLWALLPLAFAAAPQRILILHSFSRDFSPYSTIVTAFRSEMEREAHEPIAFYEAALDSGQVGSEEDTRPMVAFLRERLPAET